MVAPLTLIGLAGAMHGSFAAPLKRVPGWDEEHIWLVWWFLAMVAIPLTMAATTVPHLGAVYHSAGVRPLATTTFYGMIWGASTVLCGLGIARGGLALGFGIILGWPIFMATIVLTANAWGLLTGEWPSSGGSTAAWAVTGLVLLVGGIWMIASAGSRS
jgi:hypothetical protein